MTYHLPHGAFNLSMHELQTVMIFGIGALFLYIIVPTALLANEARLAKQSDDTSGASAVLNAIVQAAFFIVAWLLFVTIIVFLLAGAGGNSGTNPALGIWNFWYIDWLDTNTIMAAIDGSAKITGEAQKAQAKIIVLILSAAKLLELLVLGILLFLTVKLSMSLPLYKLRRVQHYQMSGDIDISSALMFLMMFMTGMVMFKFIIEVDQLLLKSVFTFADATHSTVNIPNKNLYILDDLWNIINLGKIKLTT